MHSEDLSQRVYGQFQQSLEAKMQVGEELAPLITHASEIITHALLDNKKVLVCGNASSSALAQIFSTALSDRFERERPSLPAIWLGGNISSYTSIASETGFDEVYSKSVRSLGQEGDVLVIISSSGNAKNLLPAIHAAHERAMHVVALSGRGGGEFSHLLSENDVHVCVNLNARSRIHEIHLLALFCICDLIDLHLFGS